MPPGDFGEDPTDFEGVSSPPRIASDDENPGVKAAGTRIIHGTSAAGARAVSTQLIAFYFRAPVWIQC